MSQPPDYPVQGPGQIPFTPAPYGSLPAEPTAPIPAPRKPQGLLMGAAVLGSILLLFGGGIAAYLAFGRSEGSGPASPERVVDGFLTAIFKKNDADAAARLVCASARDTRALGKRIDDLESFDGKLKAPAYTWSSPTVDSRTENSARVSVRIRLTTSDDKVSEQALRILTVKGDGWLVCEINSAT